MKLPPFGKGLNSLIKSGHHPSNDVILFIGNKAWVKGKNFSVSYPNRTLILPPWLSPDIYHWPVIGCDILIFDTGYAEDNYVEELVLCLFRYGANKVCFISHDDVFYKFTKE